MTQTITLDTITFTDQGTSGWVFSNLKDWFGSTPDKTPNDEKPIGHGSFYVGGSLRSSRAISFDATYLGASSAEVEDAVDQLSACGAEAPVLMTLATDRGSSWRTVSVVNSDPDDWYDFPETVVHVDVLAREPRRFVTGQWVSNTPAVAGTGLVWPAVWPLTWPAAGNDGTVMLQNAGRAPASPKFRVFGGFNSVLITVVGTGERIGFVRPVPEGSMVEIDVATRRALLDGTSDVSRWLRWREWVDVPALSSRRYLATYDTPTAAAYFAGRVDSAWW